MSKANDDYNRHFQGIPVIILYYDTDQIYMECESINRAAAVLGCNSGRVMRCLNNKPKTIGKKSLSITSSRGKFYIKYKKVEKNNIEIKYNGETNI